MLLTGLVAADVNIFRREHLHDLSQYCFQEGEDLFVADAEVAVLIRLTAASKLRIRRQHLLAVTRHLDFRDYLYMSFMGIFYEFAELILGVVTTMSICISLLRIMSVAGPPFLPCRLRTPCRE